MWLLSRFLVRAFSFIIRLTFVPTILCKIFFALPETLEENRFRASSTVFRHCNHTPCQIFQILQFSNNDLHYCNYSSLGFCSIELLYYFREKVLDSTKRSSYLLTPYNLVLPHNMIDCLEPFIAIFSVYARYTITAWFLSYSESNAVYDCWWLQRDVVA